MQPTKNHLSYLDKSIYGSESHWFSIATEVNNERLFLKGSAICSELTQHGIEHIGIMQAKAPYEILRFYQQGSFLLACIEGEGEVLIDGGWKRVKAGQACLLAPYMTNGLRAVEGIEWKFAWVRYAEEPRMKSVANRHRPTRGVFQCQSLSDIICGLRNELQQNPHDPVVSCWVSLLQQQVLKFVTPIQIDERLCTIWSAVLKNLANDWTLFALAQIGHISEEHLRRLNNKQLGRSPMQYLIYLRMVEARQKLLESDATIESICHEVGYKNPFSFSNTFEKWMGCRPSALR